ncbi:hypothetical protein ABT288_02615 [Streptomyces sp. NPDC001093]|uniref:hypothetical protein n=1 Tax=Streptomyces sp. NPDC001093 TaxID=3154376 RepID=UPI00332FD490
MQDVLEGNMFGKRGMPVTLCSLVLAASSLAWAPAGQATTREGGSVGCTGHSVSRYDPPLALLPRPTHVYADITYTCTVSPGRIAAATGSFSSDAPAASCVAVSGGSGQETVRYADGSRSLIVYDSASTVRVAGVLVVIQRGHVIQGRGQGHPVQRTVAGLPEELPTDCLTSGLRGGSNVVQLEIQP